MAVALSQQEQEELDAFNKAIGNDPEKPANEPAQSAAEAPTNESQAESSDDAQSADAEQSATESTESGAEGDGGGESAAAPQGTPPSSSDEDRQAQPPQQPQQPAQPTGESTPDVKTLAEQVAALRAELDAERKAKTQTTQAQPPQGTPPSSEGKEQESENDEQAPVEFVYSDEQKAAVDWLESEFPDIKKAVDAREAALRHHFEQQTNNALKEFAKQVVNWLDPIVGTHRQSLQERHLAAVKGAVPEYDEIVEALPEWIAKQPGAIGESWKRVYEGGTTDEVIALLQTFKASTGRASPPQEQGTDPKAAAAPQSTVAPPADKVHALTAVRGGGRTTPRPSAGSKQEMTEQEAFDLAIGLAPK